MKHSAAHRAYQMFWTRPVLWSFARRLTRKTGAQLWAFVSALFLPSARPLAARARARSFCAVPYTWISAGSGAALHKGNTVAADEHRLFWSLVSASLQRCSSGTHDSAVVEFVPRVTKQHTHIHLIVYTHTHTLKEPLVRESMWVVGFAATSSVVWHERPDRWLLCPQAMLMYVILFIFFSFRALCVYMCFPSVYMRLVNSSF